MQLEENIEKATEDFGCLREIVATHRTPLYVYSKRKLRARISQLRSAFDVPRFSLLFATMANDEPEILATIAQEGVGACVNSPLHLELALCAGFSPTSVQFTSTGIPLRDMLQIKARGIAVNLDSPSQIALWCQEANGGKVGARINAASMLNLDFGQGDRIGMDKADLSASIQEATMRGGMINGLHVYVGTNYQSPNQMLPTLNAFFTLAELVPDLEYVNIGGGVGVDYAHADSEFDLLSFGAQVSRLTRRLSATVGREISLLFEPGRSLVASSGTFLTRIIDIKELRGITYVTVDASIAVFPRPFHHPETPHRVRRLNSSNCCNRQDLVTVVGRTTFSRDVLARCALPCDTKIGDHLVFDDAGAYCQSMTSRFLGQEIPTCLVLND